MSQHSGPVAILKFAHHQQTIFQRTLNENFEAFSTAKCGMHKSIKLNYFEHINIFESCKQPGIDNKFSNSSLKWFLVLK